MNKNTQKEYARLAKVFWKKINNADDLCDEYVKLRRRNTYLKNRLKKLKDVKNLWESLVV